MCDQLQSPRVAAFRRTSVGRRWCRTPPTITSSAETGRPVPFPAGLCARGCGCASLACSPGWPCSTKYPQTIFPGDQNASLHFYRAAAALFASSPTARAKLIVFLAVGIGCANAQSGPPIPPGLQQVIKALDQTATASVKSGSLSFGLAVATRDGPAWTKNYGYEDAGNRTSATPHTSYRVGVAAFTGTMLLQLVRDVRVHLSDRVDKYLPEIKRIPARYPDAAPLTVLQLATHSSGLELKGTAATSFTKDTISQWETALVSALPHAVFVNEPGTHFAGACIDDAILAIALSRAAGQPYLEYVKQKIFKPLGMTHTNFESN
ncbi:MAG: serine hydrolase [Candidatus Solibacter sp.]